MIAFIGSNALGGRTVVAHVDIGVGDRISRASGELEGRCRRFVHQLVQYDCGRHSFKLDVVSSGGFAGIHGGLRKDRRMLLTLVRSYVSTRKS